MTPTVSFFPETVLSTEGDSFVWNFSLDQPVPEGGLTLNIVITQNTESQAGDASFNFEDSNGITDFNFLFGSNETLLGFTVGLAEGVTEATLVGDTTVDNILETDEIGLYTIADGEDYRADPNQNSITTIFTDRTVVTLTPEDVNVTEGETFAWNFSLNRPAPEGGLTLSLPITFNNDPEPGDVIYNVEGSNNIEDFGFIIEDDVSIGFTLTIPEGKTEATLVSEAVVDDLAEIDEIFTTVLADGLDYVANPVANQVVTTIFEDGEDPPSSVPVVSITPGTVISTEGDTFAWDITLDQPVPEGGLSLYLPITQNNDPEPGDVIYNVEGSTGITDFEFIVEDNISIGFSVTLEEGITSATLVSEAVADDNDIEEAADEIFTTVLADGVDYRANPDSNEVVTVLTREPVVTLTTDEANATEGETFAWNFSLNQPAPEGGLNLTLPITFNNDPEPGDVIYNVEGSTNITDFNFLVVDNISVGFTLTIAEGETVATLVSQAVADDLAEIDEIFTTILADGENYRANPSSREVVTTIFEQDSSSTPVVSLSADKTVVSEGGEPQLITFNFSEPTPAEGLIINLQSSSSDGEQGDVGIASELFNNIVDFGVTIENGVTVANITIAGGVTSATVGTQALADNEVEGEETYSLTLLEGENYSIDPAFSTIITTIEDTTPGNAIAIENFSFETPALPSAEESPGNFFLSVLESPTQDSVPGWKAYNPDGLITGLPRTPGITDFADAGISNVSSFYSEGAPDGKNAGYGFILNEVGSGVVGLTQTLDEQLTANTRYTLQVDVGNPAPNPFVPGDLSGFPGYRVELVAGGEVLAQDHNSLTIAEGVFETSTVSFTAPQMHSSVGEQLEIRLVNILDPSGLESNVKLVDFDNVRLFAETVATGDETIVGDESDEVLDGKDGDDLVAGGLGNDEILGGDGDDILRGDLNSRSPGGTVGGNDTISGGAGDDRIGGKGGSDELYGDEGHDSIWGDDGDDLIRGGLGDDFLVGDDFSGGSSADTFVLAAGEGTDTIVDFEVGVDIIGLADGLMAGDLAVTTADGNTTIALGDETLAILEGVVVSGDEIDFALV